MLFDILKQATTITMEVKVKLKRFAGLLAFAGVMAVQILTCYLYNGGICSVGFPSAQAQAKAKT